MFLQIIYTIILVLYLAIFCFNCYNAHREYSEQKKVQKGTCFNLVFDIIAILYAASGLLF